MSNEAETATEGCGASDAQRPVSMRGIVEHLLPEGLDVNMDVGDGRVPLLNYAASASDEDTCRLLLERGALPSATDLDYNTPLHDAARVGNTAICRMLVEAGADVRAQNDNYVTPLHLAVRGGHTDVCRYLVEHGADVHAADISEENALQLASRLGHLDICKMLADRVVEDTRKLIDACAAIQAGGENRPGQQHTIQQRQ